MSTPADAAVSCRSIGVAVEVHDSTPCRSTDSVLAPLIGDDSAPVGLDIDYHHRRALTLLGLAAFSSMASMRCTDSILPALADDFGTTSSACADVISSFAVGYGVFQLLYGGLGDRFGKFRVVAIAAFACVIGALASSVAPSLFWLRVSRFVSGATAAGIVPLTMAWIGDSVPYERRQEVLAKFLGATVSGMIAGQWLGGVLADMIGWRRGFLLLAGLFGAVGALLLLKQHRSPMTRAVGVRPPRMLLAASTVLRSAWARRVLAVTFVEGALAYGTLAFIPIHLHVRFGLSLGMSGAVLASYGAGGLVYSRLARRLLARLAEVQLAGGGGTLLAAALGLLTLIPRWQWAVPLCGFAGFGFYALHSTLQTHATQMAPAVRGTSMSLFSCSLFMGQSIGIAMGARLLERFGVGTLFLIASIGLFTLAWIFVWFLGGRRDAHVLI